jgi:hypothetical protein
MTRVSVHIDETDPLHPKPALVVNGQELIMTEREFTSLHSEMWWAVDHLKHVKKITLSAMAKRYEEVKNA